MTHIFSSWCGPCKTIAPVLNESHDRVQDRVDFYAADVDEEGMDVIAHELGVQSIPDVRSWYKGKQQEVLRPTLNKSDVDFFFDRVAEMDKQ